MKITARKHIDGHVEFKQLSDVERAFRVFSNYSIKIDVSKHVAEAFNKQAADILKNVMLTPIRGKSATMIVIDDLIDDDELRLQRLLKRAKRQKELNFMARFNSSQRK